MRSDFVGGVRKGDELVEVEKEEEDEEDDEEHEEHEEGDEEIPDIVRERCKAWTTLSNPTPTFALAFTSSWKIRRCLARCPLPAPTLPDRPPRTTCTRNL